MVPTLAGRIQTRLALLAVIGGLVTALVGPFLPAAAPLSVRYHDAYLVLATVAILGIGWELLYHLLMQWRWEKDWPSLFGLVTGVPEGILIWVLLAVHAVPGISKTPPLFAYLIDFIVVWLCVWLVTQGPVRIPFIRWRFLGGRFA